jgi:hypothetical protein
MANNFDGRQLRLVDDLLESDRQKTLPILENDEFS